MVGRSKLIKDDANFAMLAQGTQSELTLFKFACTAVILFGQNVMADMSAIGGPKSFLKHGSHKFEQTCNR
jgi:hypothetical protein